MTDPKRAATPRRATLSRTPGKTVIPEPSTVSRADTEPGCDLSSDQIAVIPLDLVDLADDQFEFRTSYRLRDLVEDISQHGQQVPVVLRPSSMTRDRYQVVCGFRRCRTLEKLGCRTVNAIVRRDLNDDAAFHLAYSENELRQDLTGLDKANAILKLRIAGRSDGQICEIFGIARRQLDRYRRLCTLPDELQKAVAAGSITTTHALTLMKVHIAHPDGLDLAVWVKRIDEENLSVRKLSRRLGAEHCRRPTRKRYIETRRNGGFRLYPMSFDPDLTSDRNQKIMVEKLEQALQLLRTAGGTDANGDD